MTESKDIEMLFKNMLVEQEEVTKQDEIYQKDIENSPLKVQWNIEGMQGYQIFEKDNYSYKFGERLENPEKSETARCDDPPEKTEESTAQPHTEPLLDDPISVKGRKRKTMYKNLTTSSSIVNCLSRAGQPIPATKVWEMLNAGGKEISLATTRASLSSMRVSLKCEKIKVDTERGPAKVTHYSLLPVSELV